MLTSANNTDFLTGTQISRFVAFHGSLPAKIP